jgi:hypothetical protein
MVVDEQTDAVGSFHGLNNVNFLEFATNEVALFRGKIDDSADIIDGGRSGI